MKSDKQTEEKSKDVGILQDLGDHDEDEEPKEKIGTLSEVGSFDKIVVWGHESIAEGDSPFIKGMDEWIKFAEAVSSQRSYSCWRLYGLPLTQSLERCISLDSRVNRERALESS